MATTTLPAKRTQTAKKRPPAKATVQKAAPTGNVLVRARVPAERLKRVEGILGELGLKPSDAINMLLAQIEIRRGLPF